MHERLMGGGQRLVGGGHRALVVIGAVLGFALLCAPVASADGPVVFERE